MSRHTWFEIGGPADLYVSPADGQQLREILRLARAEALPRFVLGAGANILVSDRGIRGIVIDTSRLDGLRVEGELLTAAAGAVMSDVAAASVAAALAGLESFFAMPGRIGGSVWMNARCYERSLSDCLESVEYLDGSLEVETVPRRDADWDYKRSPFQERDGVILGATFRLQPAGDPSPLAARMAEVKADRERKGHFLYPCAGSMFKNNRAFGMPSGMLIDKLGFRGKRLGGALVSPLHANIIVNAGGATAADIDALASEIEARVHAELGFALEREVLRVGDWS
jgi:UDP-N-acetylmuramate dehydrogenase